MLLLSSQKEEEESHPETQRSILSEMRIDYAMRERQSECKEGKEIISRFLFFGKSFVLIAFESPAVESEESLSRVRYRWLML